MNNMNIDKKELNRIVEDELNKIIEKESHRINKSESKTQEKPGVNKFDEKALKIVAIGGGTGLSTLLRGLKERTKNITAIVTVADDGGGSGVLREDLGMLPPGDIRNCILALANTEPILAQLLNFRFQEGMLKGQNFGNLFLAAMNGVCGGFEEAVQRMSDVLAVTGRVLPVTLEDIQLCAGMSDGGCVVGESKIPKYAIEHQCSIDGAFLRPIVVQPSPEVLTAIREADVIVLGPGSLFTSIIPNLLVNGIADELEKSKACKIYICNVMTQPGETTGFTVTEHLRKIEDNTGKRFIDCCLVNNTDVPEEIRSRYQKDSAEPVLLKADEAGRCPGIRFIEKDLVDFRGGLVRHNSAKLADALFELVKAVM